MTTKKKKETEAESEPELSILDRLVDLRRDIHGQNATTELIDILIDREGGDSSAVVQEIEDEHMNAAGLPTGTDATSSTTSTSTATATEVETENES